MHPANDPALRPAVFCHFCVGGADDDTVCRCPSLEDCPLSPEDRFRLRNHPAIRSLAAERFSRWMERPGGAWYVPG